MQPRSLPCRIFLVQARMSPPKSVGIFMSATEERDLKATDTRHPTSGLPNLTSDLVQKGVCAPRLWSHGWVASIQLFSRVAVLDAFRPPKARLKPLRVFTPSITIKHASYCIALKIPSHTTSSSLLDWVTTQIKFSRRHPLWVKGPFTWPIVPNESMNS